MSETSNVPVHIPKKKDNPNNPRYVLLALVALGLFSGMAIMAQMVEDGDTPYMSVETLREYFANGTYMTNGTFQYQGQMAYNLGFNKGLIHTANHTTLTGNYTYLDDNTLREYSIAQSCADFVQNLNQGVKNG